MATPKKVTAKKKASGAKKAAAPKVPTATAVAAFAGVTLAPLLKPAQIQRLRKALPGYVSLLDDVAELIAEDAIDLNLTDVTEKDLLQAQARQKDLAAREAVLEAAHRSAYQQRLVLDDAGMGMLQKVARRVQSRAEEDPNLLLRYKSLLDFLGSFRRGGRPKKQAPEPAK